MYVRSENFCQAADLSFEIGHTVHTYIHTYILIKITKNIIYIHVNDDMV
jgi:hypothetical protein